jgi:2-dehydro-3-deoxygalactonokinase
MRGEEVQIFGALQLAGTDQATLVLPGTHSKWVRVEGGRVLQLKTFMTGEVFALMAQHSILGKTLDMGGVFDGAIFLQGVDQGLADGSILHRLFAVRTLALFDRLSPGQLTSYLSGLLIGEELRTSTVTADAGPVIVIGSETLTQRYTLALQHLRIPCQCWGAEATWAGLHALSRSL